jgi:hypothetical protein
MLKEFNIFVLFSRYFSIYALNVIKLLKGSIFLAFLWHFIFKRKCCRKREKNTVATSHDSKIDPPRITGKKLDESTCQQQVLLLHY